MAGSDLLPHGALKGVKVLDLTRILAGPTATQLLGDLGADVIKVENPSTGGDDTRQWGKSVAENADLTPYFMAANRNKRSLALDIAHPEGQAIIRRLAQQADVLVENFKPGGLAKYGLDYASLRESCPRLVYASISGYGQTGPHREKPGYDLMAQGYGGMMSLTGEPDGAPMKVGVGVADVMCGMYATIGILSALRHRDLTDEGQQVELSLVDAQIAWLINEGVSYLNTGQKPLRRGNEHPSIMPYGTYETTDGHVILAVGNDSQFRRFMAFLSLEGLAEDDRFATNPARLEHRDALNEILKPALRRFSTQQVIDGMEAAKVPVGPVKTLDQVFETDQVDAREMVVTMHSGDTPLRLLGNPLKFSRTPVTYRKSPPKCGADSDEILSSDTPFKDD